MRFCSYHKEEHDDDAFSGTNRYCRKALNEYRRVKRAEEKARLAETGWKCPVCKRLTTKPRKNATRCSACIASRLWRCACGSKCLGDPVCGKCRYRSRKVRIEEQRRAALERGLPVTTGDARCGLCGRHLERLPNGTVKPHVCTA